MKWVAYFKNMCHNCHVEKNPSGKVCGENPGQIHGGKGWKNNAP